VDKRIGRVAGKLGMLSAGALGTLRHIGKAWESAKQAGRDHANARRAAAHSDEMGSLYAKVYRSSEDLLGWMVRKYEKRFVREVDQRRLDASSHEGRSKFQRGLDKVRRRAVEDWTAIMVHLYKHISAANEHMEYAHANMAPINSRYNNAVQRSATNSAAVAQSYLESLSGSRGAR
jgi:hypothetical protein